MTTAHRVTLPSLLRLPALALLCAASLLLGNCTPAGNGRAPVPGTALDGAAVVQARRCEFCHRTDVPANHTARDNCQLCHQQKGRLEYLAPPLRYVAERRPEDWLRRYLRYPFPIRQASPSRMPDLGLSDAEVDALVRHLVELAGARLTELPATGPQREAEPAPGRLVEGKQLFSKHNCGTCHSLGALHRVAIQRDAEGRPLFQPTSVFAPDLAETWQRVRPQWLVAAIRKPSHWMPWSGMPDQPMSDTDAETLAWYVLNAVPPPKATVSGQAVLAILLARCGGCHYGPDANAQPAGNPAGGAGWIATWGPRRELDLTSLEGLMKGALDDQGRRRPTVVPYAANSPLLMHLKGLKHPAMPMGADPLPPEELKLIEDWVLSGAPLK
ncbi:MAG: cytochrome c [Planctomycetes bacterium]|nr:cytochrome c [Planctomycetota bacterium]